MGLLSSIGSVFSKAGDAISSITDPVGALFNGITGASNSARTNQKYALEQTAINQANSKEMAEINQKYALQSMAKQFAYEKKSAQNAYQWQVQDLQKAGLNPILGIASGGASADTGVTAGGGTAGTGSGGGHGISSGIDLFGTATNIARTIKELGVMEANKENIEADTANKIEENPYIGKKRKAEIANLTAQTTEHSAKTVSEKTNNIVKKKALDALGLYDEDDKGTKKRPPKPTRKPKTNKEFWEDIIKD